jgi:alpha-glucosidase
MRIKIILLSLVLTASASLQAQWHSLGNLDSYQVQGDKIILVSGPSVVQITLLAQDLIRVRLAPTGTFNPDYSWAVVKTDWPIVQPTVIDGVENLRIATSELALLVKKRPLRLSFFDRQGHPLNRDDESFGMCWNGKSVRVWKEMPLTENYYGFGEKAGSLDRKHHDMTMWNSDIPAYRADTDPLYQTIPFFYGINDGRSYAIFLDNSYWSSFDMGKEFRDRYSFGADGGELNYYFFYGPSPKKILSRFTELVGRMPLPPRWSLGYQQSRWSYYPESRVRKLAQTFRQKKIPCDIIYLDIDYMEGYRIFTWGKKNFPDPKKMISDLANDGFKIAVIVDPGIKADSLYDAFRTGLAGGDFLHYPDGRLFIGRVWPGECAFPDFSRPETRRWWGNNLSSLTSVGVRGFWNDMNEPSVFDTPTKTVDLSVVHYDNGLMTPHAKNHNVYGLQMTEGTYEGVRSLVPGERPFVLTRASYAGGQRYSAAWTGDNISSWEHLAMAVPMLLNLSISGQPFVGTDIGGFVGSPDGELYARWLQLGVFSPLMRTHTEWGSKDQEPWSYGPKFEAINKATIGLRYKLLPYVYNVMIQASSTGIPAMRPLAFEYPTDGNFVRNETQFMFGDELLIAPVLWPGETKRELRLPEGMWYDYWTGKEYHGNGSVTVEAPINRIPIFVKSGAMLPTQQLLQYSDQAPIDPLTLTFYPADSSSSTYYEDDGHTFEYQNGSYWKRGIEQRRRAGSVGVTLGKVEGSYRPPDRSLMLEIVDMAKMPQKVQIAGRELQRTQTAPLQNVREGWSYDPASKVVRVKMRESSEERTVSVLR